MRLSKTCHATNVKLGKEPRMQTKPICSQLMQTWSQQPVKTKSQFSSEVQPILTRLWDEPQLVIHKHKDPSRSKLLLERLRSQPVCTRQMGHPVQNWIHSILFPTELGQTEGLDEHQLQPALPTLNYQDCLQQCHVGYCQQALVFKALSALFLMKKLLVRLKRRMKKMPTRSIASIIVISHHLLWAYDGVY